MSKKKTQIDRAIDQLEADLASMALTYDAQTAALKSAIAKLRAQQTNAPARKHTWKPG